MENFITKENIDLFLLFFLSTACVALLFTIDSNYKLLNMFICMLSTIVIVCVLIFSQKTTTLPLISTQKAVPEIITPQEKNTYVIPKSSILTIPLPKQTVKTPSTPPVSPKPSETKPQRIWNEDDIRSDGWD